MKATLHPPAGTALALRDVKAYLKVTHPSEDALLADLVKTAEDFLGEHRGHYALRRQIDVTAPLIYPRVQGLKRAIPRLYTYYPKISLAVTPIHTIDQITVQRDDGKSKTLDPSRFVLMNHLWPQQLLLKVLEGEFATLTMTVGYGNAPEDIPQTLRHQLLTLVQRLYKNRGNLEEISSRFPRRLSI